MYVQQSLILTYEAQNLILKRLGPPLALVFSSFAALLLLSMQTLWSILLLKVLHWSWTLLRTTSIRKILMVSQSRCVVGWKVVVGLEIVASTAIHILSFLHLIGTLMSQSLISYAFLLTSSIVPNSCAA